MKEAPETLPSLFPGLAEEVGCHILSYVPYYRLLGDSKVQRVSRSWNTELSRRAYHVPIEARQQALIRSCRTAEDALYVLLQPSLYKMLKFYEYLQIVALNEALCWWSLNPARRSFFESLDLPGMMINLARPHLALVRNLFRDEEFISTLSRQWQCQLVSAHAPLIDEILQNPPVDLTMSDISGLLWGHLENWKEHLERMSIVLSELEDPSLCKLGMLSEEFAEKIISNDVCFQKLSSSSLATIGKQHANIALKIIENDVLLEKIGGNLSSLTEYKVIAEALLRRDAFKNKRDYSILMSIAENHYEFAKEILENEDLSSRFEGHHLACILWGARKTHVAALYKIISNNKNLLKLLDIFSIGAVCFEAGKDLLQNEEKAPLLTGKCLQGLLNHIELGKSILENQVFLEKLKDDVNFIDNKPLGIIEKILSNELLQSGMECKTKQKARAVVDFFKNLNSFAKEIKKEKEDSGRSLTQFELYKKCLHSLQKVEEESKDEVGGAPVRLCKFPAPTLT